MLTSRHVCNTRSSTHTHIHKHTCVCTKFLWYKPAITRDSEVSGKTRGELSELLEKHVPRTDDTFRERFLVLPPGFTAGTLIYPEKSWLEIPLDSPIQRQ